MEYGGYNVTEKYSSIVEPNLYYDSIFQPGMTYTDKFQGDAASGLVKIFKSEMTEYRTRRFRRPISATRK